MLPSDARKKLKAIRTHYLCAICTIPEVFCEEHDASQRLHEIHRLTQISQQKPKPQKPRKK